MTKRMLLLSFLVILVTACQPKPETKPVDIQAEEVAINDLLNEMTKAFKEQDVTTLISLLSDEYLSLGSDPSEVWNKQEITEIWTQMLAQPFELKMLDDPLIKVAPDGQSAFAMQQYLMPFYSSKLAFRNGYHLIKVNGEWKLFSANTACVPQNEDLAKIDSVLRE